MPDKRRRVPAGDRRQQLLELAISLFARQGFNGTTTRQIAKQARINEALLFRHFPRKQDLYWAVIEHKCRATRGRTQLREQLKAFHDDQKVFAKIAEDVLRRNTEDQTLSRLLLFSALEHHGLSHRFFRNYVAQYYEILADHIREGIAAGKFRRTDPILAARGFLGMVIYHFLIQELFGAKRYQKFDLQHVADTLADIWLRGVLAKPEGAAERLN